METHEILLLLHAHDEHNKIGPLNLVQGQKIGCQTCDQSSFLELRNYGDFVVEGGPN
jgi:hypothetical protein